MTGKRWFGIAALVLVLATGGGLYYWVSQTPAGAEWWHFTVLDETAMEHAERHADPGFTCPMHPEVRSDEPGTCPICGMDLVPVADVDKAQDKDPDEREILYWVAPMDPTYRRDEPGQSPMGMDLVPVYADDVDDEPDVVRIRPTVIQNMNLRLAHANRTSLEREIHAFGHVDYDEERISHVHTRVEGWIENLAVRAAGERVAKNDLLFELYSRELVNAQEEFIQALRHGRDPMVQAARERLRALGVGPAQIDELEETRQVRQFVEIRARQSGIVKALNVREGMYVTPGTEVMSLVDLSTVWVIADLFEHQADWVHAGNPAEVRLPYRPGNTLEGQVDYIYPDLDRQTRTVPVRLRFENNDGTLKPGMYARVTIGTEGREDVLVVPSEAVIRTGRHDRVMVHLGDGRFRAQEVHIGAMAGDRVEILHGLREDDEVVVSGQFLIDSETNVRAAGLRMEPVAGETAAETVPGVGVIRRIDAEERRVTLHHEPMPELEWPEMTMDFRVAGDVDLAAFSEDDEIRFRVRPEPDDDGMYVITGMDREA